MDLDKLPRSELTFVEPMLAKPVDHLPDDSDWEYEIKLDGYRALAIKSGGKPARDVPSRDRFYRWQIEGNTLQMRMRSGDLYAEEACRAADVVKCLEL